MDRKVGDCCAPLRGGAESPSNTISPGPRPTCVPSGILIHPTVWPQYTNVTDRQDRQDNGPVAYGKPLLVTFAQKRLCRKTSDKILSLLTFRNYRIDDNNATLKDFKFDRYLTFVSNSVNFTCTVL